VRVRVTPADAMHTALTGPVRWRGGLWDGRAVERACRER
jgi:hypothetical protein